MDTVLTAAAPALAVAAVLAAGKLFLDVRDLKTTVNAQAEILKAVAPLPTVLNALKDTLGDMRTAFRHLVRRQDHMARQQARHGEALAFLAGQASRGDGESFDTAGLVEHDDDESDDLIGG